MGVKERKERERRELRQKIVSSASKLFLKHGFGQTNMRMIADDIEYSIGTLYSHFKDKNEIFYEVMLKAFEKFLAHLQQFMDIQDPLDRLKALNRGYLQFARENKDLYELMFVQMEPMQIDDHSEAVKKGMQSHHILQSTVQACVEKGYFKGFEANALAMQIWSSLHGLIALDSRRRMPLASVEESKQMMEAVLQSINLNLDKLNEERA